jgi:O-antigen ligase
MIYILKTLIAALVIVAATEISKRSSTMAALILALPIVSITAFVWVYMETKDKIKISEISEETFWYVIPTLPMFLLLAWMLRNNYNFYSSLIICSALTSGLFTVVQYYLAK